MTRLPNLFSLPAVPSALGFRKISALCGFDDTSLSRSLEITSIHQDFESIGREASRILLSTLENPAAEPENCAAGDTCSPGILASNDKNRILKPDHFSSEFSSRNFRISLAAAMHKYFYGMLPPLPVLRNILYAHHNFLERLPQCRIQRCSLITVHKIFQHPAAGACFHNSGGMPDEIPHPSAHGYTEQRRRMDHRLIKKTPFFLLYWMPQTQAKKLSALP